MATIIGERGFQYLPDEFGLPGVIAGFEPEDILLAVYLLLRQIKEGRPRIENAYPRAVSHDGNILAQKMLARCFEARGDGCKWLLPGVYDISPSGVHTPIPLKSSECLHDTLCSTARKAAWTPSCTFRTALTGRGTSARSSS